MRMITAGDALIQELRARIHVEPRRPMWDGDKAGLHPLAPSEAIEAAEAMLGFSLPALLRRISQAKRVSSTPGATSVRGSARG
jgi:hypothetical protein